MHLIVNISELQYEAIMKSKNLKDVKADYIRNAIVLPKGHGDLIDLGILGSEEVEQDNPFIKISMNGEEIEALPLNYLFSLPITIEADKGE